MGSTAWGGRRLAFGERKSIKIGKMGPDGKPDFGTVYDAAIIGPELRLVTAYNRGVPAEFPREHLGKPVIFVGQYAKDVAKLAIEYLISLVDEAAKLCDLAE